jgi:hypothetical protein
MNTLPSQELIMTTEGKFEPALMVNVGFMAVGWSLLEHLLMSCIIWLTKIDALDGVILTDRMSVTRKLDVIKILLETKNFETNAQKEFDQLADKIKTTSTRRNTITHGMWLDGTAPGP